MKLIIFVLVLISSFIILFSGANGCKPASSNGYRLLTVKDPIASYSFEYPVEYRVDGPSFENNTIWNYSTVGLLHRTIKKPMTIPNVQKGEVETTFVTYSPLGISVWVEDRTGRSDSGLILSIEDFVFRNTKEPNFRILFRGNVTLDGIEVEQLSFTDTPLAFITPNDSVSKISFHKLIMFKHNNFFLRLEVTADEDLMDEANSSFDHLVQSFKINNLNAN